jgi:hypothetical protein
MTGGEIFVMGFLWIQAQGTLGPAFLVKAPVNTSLRKRSTSSLQMFIHDR